MLRSFLDLKEAVDDALTILKLDLKLNIIEWEEVGELTFTNAFWENYNQLELSALPINIQSDTVDQTYGKHASRRNSNIYFNLSAEEGYFGRYVKSISARRRCYSSIRINILRSRWV